MFFSFAALLALGAATAAATDCISPGSVTCRRTDTPPTLDGDLSDWADVIGITTPLMMSETMVMYGPGNLDIKCLYDDTRIYFALMVPGAFRFSTEDNKLCAAVATMLKIGEKATFVDMGGCPEENACDSEACTPYKVDIGAHWELATTQQKQTYGMNVDGGTGDDPVANKDDEYAVNPEYRFDDSGDGAGNEWAGAWAHLPEVSAVQAKAGISLEGDSGEYVFELSRLLTTNSPSTDRQLEGGETYSFGVAYWDPNQNATSGWTEADHYVTGCARDFIDLILEEDITEAPTAATSAATSQDSKMAMVLVINIFGLIIASTL